MARKKKAGRGGARGGAEVPVRRFPRISARHSIVVRKIGGPVSGGLATTAVMGLGGCCFLHKEPQGVGETLYLSILIGEDLVEARVRVVYEKAREDGQYEVGVAFQEVPSKDVARIQALVDESSDEVQP